MVVRPEELNNDDSIAEKDLAENKSSEQEQIEEIEPKKNRLLKKCP